MNYIQILSDNNPHSQLLCEHGLSFYISYNSKSYIFDTGASHIFKHNAQSLGIDINTVPTVILSHGHWDHGNGLNHFSNKPILIAHPHIHTRRYRLDKSYIGLSLDKEKLQELFTLDYHSESYEITEGMFFLTNISRSNVDANFVVDSGAFDELDDDSSIVLKTPKGLVLISGCAHAGIINHITEACRITGERSVYAIIGGLHIKTAEEAHEIGPFLKMHVETTVYTGHCTSRNALMTLAQYVPVQGIYSGFKYKL